MQCFRVVCKNCWSLILECVSRDLYYCTTRHESGSGTQHYDMNQTGAVKLSSVHPKIFTFVIVFLPQQLVLSYDNVFCFYPLNSSSGEGCPKSEPAQRQVIELVVKRPPVLFMRGEFCWDHESVRKKSKQNTTVIS